jgi:hypothetical protein
MPALIPTLLASAALEYTSPATLNLDSDWLPVGSAANANKIAKMRPRLLQRALARPWTPVNYSTNQVLTDADAGKEIKSTNQSANIWYTLPTGGGTDLPFLFHCDSDTYTLTLTPNGSERIGYGLATKALTILARGKVGLRWETDRWEIVLDAAIYEITP